MENTGSLEQGVDLCVVGISRSVFLLLRRDLAGRRPIKPKRVFSPGFIAFCALVAVFELIVLNHFYGASR